MNVSDRDNFSPEYISKELKRIDEVLDEKLSVYLLGGAVMAVNGLKTGTKDIDVIVQDKNSHSVLVHSLEKCEYFMLQSQDLTRPYRELSATALQNREGFGGKFLSST